jgi:hypothetical protein
MLLAVYNQSFEVGDRISDTIHILFLAAQMYSTISLVLYHKLQLGTVDFCMCNGFTNHFYNCVRGKRKAFCLWLNNTYVCMCGEMDVACKHLHVLQCTSHIFQYVLCLQCMVEVPACEKIHYVIPT